MALGQGCVLLLYSALSLEHGPLFLFSRIRSSVSSSSLLLVGGEEEIGTIDKPFVS